MPFAGTGAGWGDAKTVVPTALYDAYDRRGLLRRHYPAMGAWVEFTAGRLDAGGTWSGNAQLGDWLDLSAPPEDPARATPPPQTCCALALKFAVAPAAEREAVGDALAALVHANGGRNATGFLGTRSSTVR
ncbi:hypothetical protein U5640_43260 [Streptomyces sp. SS7]|uniref:alpha-L-rhamnosidase-related protein n=1 Tax=Streptomyces sp. SS7 TaxID=3108485 RepID=UPI0030EF2523